MNRVRQPPRMWTPGCIPRNTFSLQALIAMFGCGRPCTTHLEKKKSKADYRFPRELTAEETRTVEERVNEWIGRDLPVWEEFLPRPDAEQRYDVVRLPATAGATVRIVHIGDADACPCSGKHVASTQAIGHFRIVSTTYEAGALRVRFKLEANPKDRDETCP